MRIGEQIREIRKAQGLSMQTLADKAGVTYAAVLRIELGKNYPRIDTVELILKTLGYHVEIVKDEPETDCPWK